MGGQTRNGYLDLLRERLRERMSRGRRRDYLIPGAWDCGGYGEAEPGGGGQVAVPPHRFLLQCLDRVILPARGRGTGAGRSLSRTRGVRQLAGEGVLDGKVRRRGGDWVRGASFYGMLLRTTTAWDHNGDGGLRSARGWTETGTFVKSILLLPLLARMGINVLYLLPISKCSQVFRKGEVGCPYSARNFFELEPELHDRLLGSDDADVEMEFGALVEAAHALGMRVMIDLAPRTASRDSDLILDHPEWFYWIDRRAERGYGPLRFEGFPHGIPRRSRFGRLFGYDVLQEHLRHFRHAPSVTDPARWRRFASRCRADPPRDLLSAIKREFGVTTPPGFSDVVNDPQPPWSDVTYLRLYLDHPAASVRHLDDASAQPPYVFTDSIKSSLFPGRRPNRALWKTLASILPFYQRFGVDGARVDMGHALPPELQGMIVEQARRHDPDFCFLAEQFDHGAAGRARREGYNALIGSSWWMEPRAGQGELHKLTHEVLPTCALPSWAGAETPDTPRAVVREGGRKFARMMAVVNHFLPGGIPFVNSGFELHERQPMNLGLDACPPGRFALARSDPYSGKLAYFDRVALHWRNRGAGDMVELLGRAGQIRARFLDELTDARNYFRPRVTMNARRVLAIGWRVNGGKRTLLVVGNVDFERRRRVVIDQVPGGRGERECEALLELCPSRSRAVVKSGTLRLSLEAGEVKVLLL